MVENCEKGIDEQGDIQQAVVGDWRKLNQGRRKLDKKYFDSIDYALAKQKNVSSDDLYDAGIIGTEHPSPERLLKKEERRKNK